MTPRFAEQIVIAFLVVGDMKKNAVYRQLAKVTGFYFIHVITGQAQFDRTSVSQSYGKNGKDSNTLYTILLTSVS